MWLFYFWEEEIIALLEFCRDEILVEVFSLLQHAISYSNYLIFRYKFEYMLTDRDLLVVI